MIPAGATLTGATPGSTLTADTKVTVNGINGLHALGYTLEDPPEEWNPFFTLKDGATEFNASSLTVNPDIVKKVANIAASSRTYVDTDGVPK